MSGDLSDASAVVCCGSEDTVAVRAMASWLFPNPEASRPYLGHTEAVRTLRR